MRTRVEVDYRPQGGRDVDQELEARIARAAGRKVTATGISRAGVRAVDFVCDDGDEAEQLAAKISQGLTTSRISVRCVNAEGREAFDYGHLG